MVQKRMLRGSAAALALASALGCGDETTPSAEVTLFERTDLVSDRAGAVSTDPNLVNPWGLAFGPETFFWVANNGTSTSTLYDGEGGIQSDAVGGPVALPSITEDGQSEGPTGVVFNPGTGFVIDPPSGSGPARFVFATTAGRLMGWSPDVDPRNAIVAVDRSSSGAIYTGLAIASRGTGHLLYAANFSGARIDVFDESWAMPSELQGLFVDPSLPAGYAPFNVQEIGGTIYVAYAKQNAEGDEEQAGPGLGFVSAFDVNGGFVARIASGGVLNAPWGITRAPDEFGVFGGALLVGNFGDGHISAIDLPSHQVIGQIAGADGKAIAIDGLWALSFGNGRNAGEEDDLYFTAGPDDETHGVFGEIAVIPQQQ